MGFTVSVTLPRVGVYLSAFESRLKSTFSYLSGSIQTRSFVERMSTASSICFSSNPFWNISTIDSMRFVTR